jgi:hypothetical protein
MAQSSDIVLAHGIEQIEAEAWADLQSCLPAAVRQQLGISIVRHAGSVLLIASRASALAMNRTIALGFERPMSGDDLAIVIAAYEAAGVPRFVVQWSPLARPREASDLFADRGFTMRSHMAKLVRPADAPLEMETQSSRLSVREIGVESTAIFEEIVAEPLGAPLGIAVGSTVGQPNWHHYIALADDRPVAGAALYIRGEHAWCGLAATLERDRGRGAHSALLRRRVADAAAAGCRSLAKRSLGPSPARRNPGAISSGQDSGYSMSGPIMFSVVRTRALSRDAMTIHLAGLLLAALLVREASAQSPPRKPTIASPVGTWRGTSECLVRPSACTDEDVVYRITQMKAADSVALDARKIVRGEEQDMGVLGCRVAPSSGQITCILPQGVWHFTVRNDSLTGELRLKGNSKYRDVRTVRAP